MRSGIVLLLAAAAGLFAIAPGPAKAQTTMWAITGAACIPTGQSVAGPGTFSSSGDVRFPDGRLGEIILTCPVPSSLFSSADMAITYRDTDGGGNGVVLRAALRQKELETGAVSTISGVVLSSNSSSIRNNVRRSVPFPNFCSTGNLFLFDHHRFTYYIQVNMIRSRRDHEVILISAELRTFGSCN